MPLMTASRFFVPRLGSEQVPRMLKGDYYPDFTAEMMHKDISLGLGLWLWENRSDRHNAADGRWGPAR